jgi:hypothetical protein
MTQHTSHHGMLLLTVALLFFALLGTASAADLEIDKTVISGHYFVGEEINWSVTVRNTAEETLKDILVEEDTTNIDMEIISNTTTHGSYEAGVWNIPVLETDTTATLTLLTVITSSGKQTNRVNVTSINGTDQGGLINATFDIIIGEPITAEMTIKPETLNLKSQGTFTVFINVSGVDGSEIDWENADISCNDSVLRKVIIAGENGEKLIAKFSRNTLDVTAGEPVTISCVGYVKVGEDEIKVEGSDEIRVIKERVQANSLLDKLLRFLGLKNDEEIIAEEGEEVPPLTLPDTVKNLGQAKKFLNTPVPDGTEEEADDGSEEDPAPGSSNAGGKGNPKNEETTDDSCPGNKCLNNEKEKEK